MQSSERINPVQLLRIMALAREGDRREGILLRQGKGWFQVPSAGHEALAAIIDCFTPDDVMYLYYRDRALALARGVTNYEMALSFFAKAESSSMGRQMPSHYSDANLNIASTASPTGLQALPAVGSAWAKKLKKEKSAVLCCIGEAATRQGEFYEALCFALQEKLPVVFLIEDNGFAISTPTAHLTPHHIGALDSQCILEINGRIPSEVYSAGMQAVSKARNGEGPTVIWADIDRLSSHTSSDDHRVYRSMDDINAMMSRDPIDLLLSELIRNNQITAEAWASELSAIQKSVDEDYLQAANAEEPSVEEIAYHVLDIEPSPIDPKLPEQDDYTMAGVINSTLLHLLESDDRVILFGEDIEDPKGGVFGLTKGLSSRFPDRVFNSPLAEATIAGVAVGLAAEGFKPFFEFQFIDFAGPAFTQITSQLATMRWRTGGQYKCPVVLMAPSGAYLPGGAIWHSQSNEAYYAHTPGLRVLMPSNPADAAGLLLCAMAGDDPVMFLMPKHLFRKRVALNGVEPVSYRARKVSEGTDVTIVSWGNCVEVVESALVLLNAKGISAEALDLRSLSPWDYQSVAESVAKTGRLVVVQEDTRTCSLGQAVIAEMTSRPESWDYFAAPPALLSRPDVNVPYNAILEESILPQANDVVNAVENLMRY